MKRLLAVYLAGWIMTGCAMLQPQPMQSSQRLNVDVDGNNATDEAYGGTNANTFEQARTNLGVAIGSDVQGYDADLDTFSGITPSTDVQTMLGAADAEAIRAAVGLVIDTNVQAYSGALDSIAGLTETNGGLLYGTAEDTYAWLAAGASGKILIGKGAAAPEWTPYTFPATVPTVGKVLISDGTNMIGSTALGTAAYTASGDYQASNAYLSDIAAISPVQGDILYFNGTDWVALGYGTSGYYLKTQGAAANPTWAAPTSGVGSSSDKEMLFNNAGSVDGAPKLLWNGTKFDLDAELALGSNASITGITTLSLSNGDTSAGYLEFYEDSDNGTNKVTLIGPSSTADVTVTLPATAGTIPVIVASGTKALATSEIASGACSAAQDGGTATGVVTTDLIDWTPNADPTGVTGYEVSATGSLYIWAYPTSDHVNFKVCNNTAGALTPGALTLNWRVMR